MESDEVGALRRILHPVGLNLIGVASVRDYDEVAPEGYRLGVRWPRARSAIVVGSGGSAFWRAAVAASHGAHPLDDFAVSTLERVAAETLGGLDPVLLFPHRFDAEPVSFMHLAECAGLGARSLLGILIRPDYGTWFGLRATVLVCADLEPSPRSGFDPCPECDKPCIGACPAGAVSRRGWDIPTCVASRLEGDACGDGCHSRLACPYGRDHRYPVEEQRHHQGYARGSMRSRAAFLASGSS